MLTIGIYPARSYLNLAYLGSIISEGNRLQGLASETLSCPRLQSHFAKWLKQRKAFARGIIGVRKLFLRKRVSRMPPNAKISRASTLQNSISFSFFGSGRRASALATVWTQSKASNSFREAEPWGFLKWRKHFAILRIYFFSKIDTKISRERAYPSAKKY